MTIIYAIASMIVIALIAHTVLTRNLPKRKNDWHYGRLNTGTIKADLGMYQPPIRLEHNRLVRQEKHQSQMIIGEQGYTQHWLIGFDDVSVHPYSCGSADTLIERTHDGMRVIVWGKCALHAFQVAKGSHNVK